jgi:hypothetical protein
MRNRISTRSSEEEQEPSKFKVGGSSPSGYTTVVYRSKEFYQLRNKLINSLPKKATMTPHQLATELLKGKISELTFDAHMLTLFPEFMGYFSSEKPEKALAFVSQYLPECTASIDYNISEVKIIRYELVSGVGEYPNVLARASFAGKIPLARAIMCAALFAYSYLFS